MTMEELLELPVVTDLKTAARAFGIGKNAAYGMAAAGTFPCEVKRFGQRYCVTRPHLFAALGLDPAMVNSAMVNQPGESGENVPVVVVDQRDGLSGNSVRALYEALMAAARVLADRNAAP